MTVEYARIKIAVSIMQTGSVAIMATGRMEMGPTGRTVAANVKRLREARGLTLRALSERLSAASDRLGDAGRKISADAINKIENGALPDAQHIRRVDTDDLVALAVALEVNPSALLLPPAAEGEAEVTGVGRVDAGAAWDWADGKKPLHVPADDDGTALLDFTRWARPRGRRRRYNITTPAGRDAALSDANYDHDRDGADA